MAPGRKGELSAFDVLVLADEFGRAAGASVDKVLQPEPGELVLRLKMPGGGRFELVVSQGRWAYLREREVSEGGHPPAFAMLLRKHLENTRLTSVEQRGFERILLLRFGEAELVLELFGEGNVVLVRGGVIVQPLCTQEWEHRAVRPGVEYAFPPARVDPRALGPEELGRLLASSKSDLVRTLAVSVNLGGKHAEELCARTGLDGALKAARLGAEDARLLHGAIRELFSEVLSGRRPALVLDGQAPVDFSPVPLRSQSGLERRECPTLSSAVSAYVAYWKGRKEAEGRERSVEQEAARLERQIAAQERALESFREQAAGERAEGDLLSARVDEIAAVLEEVRRSREAGGWKAVQKAVREGRFGPEAEALPQEGAMVVGCAGRKLKLDIRTSAREQAASRYTAAKEAGEKARRTQKQIEESREKLRRLREGGLPREEGPAAPAGPRRTPFWFERYRWFISSDGNVVIAGRDASDNDRIVKRHMKEGDAYAHADLHGAPSVIVKGGKGEMPAATLREACEFALCCSKAWGASLASGSAYWVRPDQVSKTPESGEYLPRGAFIVRGRKNFHHDLPLRLGIGWVEFQGRRLLMCGPPSSFQGRSGKQVLIQPGEEAPKAVARAVSRELGCGEEEALRLLPAGKAVILLNP